MLHDNPSTPEALTDDVARENWEKYGNPDGKQSFEMSIGLPTFLMEKDNHNLILIVYLILMVVVVPSLVYMYYKQSQMYGEGNVLYRTYQTYANLLLPGNNRPVVTTVRTMSFRAIARNVTGKVFKHFYGTIHCSSPVESAS